jgi:UrcA family protein
MKYRFILALVAGGLLATPAALQASNDVVTIPADIHGLDLSEPGDVGRAERRIAHAVKKACRSDPGYLSPSARRVMLSCRKTAREAAMQKLRSIELRQLAAQGSGAARQP